MKRAIYHISFSSKSATVGKESALVYDILRKYTPEVREGASFDFYFELTGLRTFFKMDYEELISSIKKSVEKETKHRVIIEESSTKLFDAHKKKSSSQSKTISTYKEIRNLLSKATEKPKNIIKRRVKLTVPFLGKVD